MTRAQKRRRRSEIIRELSRLSRNGWRDATPQDYERLEQELWELERELWPTTLTT
jgi:hypothetical protein